MHFHNFRTEEIEIEKMIVGVKRIRIRNRANVIAKVRKVVAKKEIAIRKVQKRRTVRMRKIRVEVEKVILKAIQ